MGTKVKVAAEFGGSEQLGLPSTTDRDKFIALLKILSEERVKTGQIANPIRFSGYRMIQELGLSRNGGIYEEIVRWGKRMTDTTNYFREGSLSRCEEGYPQSAQQVMEVHCLR